MTSLHGDEADLFRRHHRGLVGALQGRLKVRPYIAEEAAQFAWLQLCRCEVQRDNVVGWLYTVAKYEVFAIARRERREQAVEELPEHSYEPCPEARIERQELLEALVSTMAAELSDNQLTALGLWAQGYSYKEMVLELDRTYSWVNRHVSEGIERLRKRLNPRD